MKFSAAALQMLRSGGTGIEGRRIYISCAPQHLQCCGILNLGRILRHGRFENSKITKNKVMKFSAAALQMLRSGGFTSHVLRNICNAAEY